MPLPALLLDGFRAGPQRTPLLRLGFVHAAMVLALVLVASAFAIDELRNWKVSDGQLDPASVSQNIPWDALTVSVLLYTPVLMLTWFAPQLVAWHRQTGRQGDVLLVLRLLAQQVAVPRAGPGPD